MNSYKSLRSNRRLEKALAAEYHQVNTGTWLDGGVVNRYESYQLSPIMCPASSAPGGLQLG
jgi:hypothetical protein